MVTLLAALALSSCGDAGEPTIQIVLVPDEAFDYVDVEGDLEEAVGILQERLAAFDVDGGEARREGDQIVLELAESTAEEPIALLSGQGLLQFCEPVTDEARNVAVVAAGGRVEYEPQSCRPVRNGQGDIVVEGGVVEFVPWARSDSAQAANNPPADQIVWQPASGELGGTEAELTGMLLEATSVVANPDTLDTLNLWLLEFTWTDDGSELAGQVTDASHSRTCPWPYSSTANPCSARMAPSSRPGSKARSRTRV
jgi:hypothetical protein